VGSQQRDISAWSAAIGKTKYIFDLLKEKGINLQCINLGGGFPGNYLDRRYSIKDYSDEISRYLHESFGNGMPQIMIEPGRAVAAEAGVIVSEVVLTARKSKNSLERWVFTDVGKFGGLMETLNELIKYPLFTEIEGDLEKVIIAGPTCDSIDTIYEEFKYELPSGLTQGDRIYWLSTGAYTASYSSVEFNGFPPLKTFYI
jgi:ornithine decarboxylase